MNSIRAMMNCGFGAFLGLAAVLTNAPSAQAQSLVRDDMIAAIKSYLEIYGAVNDESEAAQGQDRAITCRLPSKAQPRTESNAQAGNSAPALDPEAVFQKAREEARRMQQNLDGIQRQAQLAKATEALSNYIVSMNTQDFNEVLASLLAVYHLDPQEGYYKPKAVSALLHQISQDVRKEKIVSEKDHSVWTRAYTGSLAALTLLSIAGSLAKFGQSAAYRAFVNAHRAEGLAAAISAGSKGLARGTGNAFVDAWRQFLAGAGAFGRGTAGAGRGARDIWYAFMGNQVAGQRMIGAAKAFGSSMKQLGKSVVNGAKMLGTKRFWTHKITFLDASPQMQRNMLFTLGFTAAYTAVPDDHNFVHQFFFGEIQRDKLDPLPTLSLINAKGVFDLGEQIVKELVEPAFAQVPDLDRSGDFSAESLKLFDQEESAQSIQFKIYDACEMLKLYSQANNDQKELSPEYLEAVGLPEFHREYQSAFGYSEKPEYQKLLTETESAPEVSLHAIDEVLTMLKTRLERVDAKIVEIREARAAEKAKREKAQQKK